MRDSVSDSIWNPFGCKYTICRDERSDLLQVWMEKELPIAVSEIKICTIAR